MQNGKDESPFEETSNELVSKNIKIHKQERRKRFWVYGSLIFWLLDSGLSLVLYKNTTHLIFFIFWIVFLMFIIGRDYRNRKMIHPSDERGQKNTATIER